MARKTQVLENEQCWNDEKQDVNISDGKWRVREKKGKLKTACPIRQRASVAAHKTKKNQKHRK